MAETVITTHPASCIGETCEKICHASGLTILVWHKPEYRSTYALFATRYGSIDTSFWVEGASEPMVVPAGIAHYLEHKLFENEDCDAFERYAQVGADANAYTSFDRTGYLFSCTDHAEESLRILLDFVQKPYFTEESVQKEQGIIGQEIRMGEDSPYRTVFHNLMSGLYERHPVRLEIAGTVESIAEITPELLYGCYRTFYNLNNMVLAVAGNLSLERVAAIADEMLQPAEPFLARRSYVAEKREAWKPRVEAIMPVASPLFYLGFKQPFTEEDGVRYLTATEQAAVAVLQDLIVGRASPLYYRLLEEGLINNSFFFDVIDGAGYMVWLFGGESEDPDRVMTALNEEIARMRTEGIDSEAFAAARNALYGQIVSGLNSVENCGDLLADDFFCGAAPFERLQAVAELTEKDVTTLLEKSLYPSMATLSVVRAK